MKQCTPKISDFDSLIINNEELYRGDRPDESRGMRKFQIIITEADLIVYTSLRISV